MAFYLRDVFIPLANFKAFFTQRNKKRKNLFIVICVGDFLHVQESIFSSLERKHDD
jgi:hypothetical protein